MALLSRSSRTRPPSLRSAGTERAGAATRSKRWLIAAMLTGALAALLLFAPASWLAGVVSDLSGNHLTLADAEGTVWNGQATLVLTGGSGSRDARALPGRLQWTLRPGSGHWGWGALLKLRHDCCLPEGLAVRLHPGLGSGRAEILPGSAVGSSTNASAGLQLLGQWPASVLVGLGTPWNTLQPGGALRLSAEGLSLQWAEGRLNLQGRATLDLVDMSSRLATLPRLGSYRLSANADPSQPGTARVSLTTLDGALQLTGDGSWGAGGLRLRGEAAAAAQDESVLSNLLNIIGRRQGARSLISIG